LKVVEYCREEIFPGLTNEQEQDIDEAIIIAERAARAVRGNKPQEALLQIERLFPILQAIKHA
jgi:hypothetical protein